MKSPLDLLLPYQRDFFDDQSRFKGGLWARQTGKDFTLSCEVVVDAKLNGAPWMLAAPSERQALETLYKCKDWSEAFDLAIEDIVEERDSPGALMRSTEIRYANGGRIIAVPGKPDTVRGMSMNVGLTEFAFFEDPDATWRAIYPSITNPLRGGKKKMRVISTPNGKSGRGRKFYELVRDNLLEPVVGRKAKWSVHKVTIDDAIRRGLPIDLDELLEGMNDPEGIAQEYRLEFLDTSNVLLPYDIIALAESADASEMADPAIFEGSGRLFCGIDFGRQNDPTVCWTLEQVGDVFITREVLVLKRVPTPEQQEILATRIGASVLTCYDYTGPGIGLGDYMVKSHGEYKPSDHKFGKVELCNFSATFKREIFPKLRRAFESPVALRIPISVDVREDLHAVTQTVSGTNYKYDSPRTSKGHSDRCTALALCNRARTLGAGMMTPPRRFRARGNNRLARMIAARRNRRHVGA